MNILLLNDTRNSSNPGCQVTTNGLLRLIKDNWKYSHIYTLPIGFGYNFFYDSYGGKLNLLFNRNRYTFKVWKFLRDKIRVDYKKNINYERWIKSAKKLYDKNDKFSNLVKKSDLIIINMEGTIHHNSIGGLTLLGMAYIAKEICNKKVYLVNGTIQRFDKKILDSVLPFVDKISVREPYSFRWLKKQNYEPVQAADCAFLVNIFNDKYIKPDISNDKPKCLYTPGVLAMMSEMEAPRILQHLITIKEKGYEPVFFVIDYNSNLKKIIEKVKELNISICYAEEVSWSSIGSYIKEFDLVISGRYHMLIFSLMARVPVIPMKSNTWKIKGVLELSNLKNRIIKNEKLNFDESYILSKELIDIEKLAHNNIF